MESPNGHLDDAPHIIDVDNSDIMASQCYPAGLAPLEDAQNCPHCGTYFAEEPVRLLNHYAACGITCLLVLLCLGCIVLAVVCMMLTTLGGGKCDGLSRVFGNCRCTPGTCIGCNAGLLCQGTRCDTCSRSLCACCYSNYLVCSQCKTMSQALRK